MSFARRALRFLGDPRWEWAVLAVVAVGWVVLDQAFCAACTAFMAGSALHHSNREHKRKEAPE